MRGILFYNLKNYYSYLLLTPIWQLRKKGLGGYVTIKKKTLRDDPYWGLMDAVYKGDINLTKVGKTFILPSSHFGSPRYKIQNY